MKNTEPYYNLIYTSDLCIELKKFNFSTFVSLHFSPSTKFSLKLKIIFLCFFSLTINTNLSVSIFVCSFKECFCLIISQISTLLRKALQNIPEEKKYILLHRGITLEHVAVYSICCVSFRSSMFLVFLCVRECLTWVHPPLWSHYHLHPKPGRPVWPPRPTSLSFPPVQKTFWGRMFLLQKVKTEHVEFIII